MKYKRTKLIYGVGINDAEYNVRRSERVGGKRIVVWRCPFHVRWATMFARCCSGTWPSYKECSITDSWLTFSNFKSWMEQQDWEGKELDKDILYPGNKIYAPDRCVFVDAKVNSFVLESEAARGSYPIGVFLEKRTGNFEARCKSVVTPCKQEYLGQFKTPEEAHQAWLAFKLQQAYILAAEQTDERVAKALIERYENYTKYA